MKEPTVDFSKFLGTYTMEESREVVKEMNALIRAADPNVEPINSITKQTNREELFSLIQADLKKHETPLAPSTDLLWTCLNWVEKTIEARDFEAVVLNMEKAVLASLFLLPKGYGNRKWQIAEETGIPLDVLTVILKRLKNAQKIELIMIWSEQTGLPNGSGYCVSGSLQNELKK